MFDLTAERSRTRAFGMDRKTEVETDITGHALARRNFKVQQPVVHVTVEAMDVADFERRTGHISKIVAKSLLLGDSQLADNVAYATG